MLATLNGLGATEPLGGLKTSCTLACSAKGLKYELPGVKVGMCTLLRRLWSSPSEVDVAGLEASFETLMAWVPGPVLDPASGVIASSVLTSMLFFGLRPDLEADGAFVLSGSGCPGIYGT
jgi:hypothetical protein